MYYLYVCVSVLIPNIMSGIYINACGRKHNIPFPLELLFLGNTVSDRKWPPAEHCRRHCTVPL